MEDKRITGLIRKRLAGEMLDSQEQGILDRWLVIDNNKEVYADYQRNMGARFRPENTG